MTDLSQRKCVACRGDTPALSDEKIKEYLALVEGWEDFGEYIEKDFVFKDFKEALAFFDAVAAVAIEEDHHPDMSLLGYKTVQLTFSTHAIKDLSDNDFVMAAKADQIFRNMKK